MHSQYIVDRVRQLLAEGKISHRAVSKRLGISRGSVANIARGLRRDRAADRALAEENWDSPLSSPVPPERCPQCGKMVYPPCRLCALQTLKKRRLDRPLSPQAEDFRAELELELKPRERERYEIVRKRRQRNDFEGQKNNFGRPTIGRPVIQGKNA